MQTSNVSKFSLNQSLDALRKESKRWSNAYLLTQVAAEARRYEALRLADVNDPMIHVAYERLVVVQMEALERMNK